MTDVNNEIEMSKELFFRANLDERINTLREEIMVLYLERVLIPEAVMGNDENDAMTNTIKLNEIIAHFITNLCGNGHYWLRRYCLDHYKLIGNSATYPIELFDEIVEELELKTNKKNTQAQN